MTIGIDTCVYISYNENSNSIYEINRNVKKEEWTNFDPFDAVKKV